MSDVLLGANFRLVTDCPKCKSELSIAGSKLRYQQMESSQKKKGLETRYSALWGEKCPNCKEMIDVQLDIWEYPTDHVNDMRVTFPGYPQTDEKPDFSKLMEAPLYDKTGKNKIGTFTIKASDNFRVRCTECDREYDLNCEELVYTYSEDEESEKKSGTITHVTSWDKVCECETELRIGHLVYSELHGIIHDTAFCPTNCAVLSEPRLTSVQHTPD